MIHIFFRISKEQKFISKNFHIGKIIFPAASRYTGLSTCSVCVGIYIRFRSPLRQFDLYGICQHSCTWIYNGPVILPNHFRKECFPSHRGIPFLGSYCQHSHIPLTCRCFNQICMSYIFNRIVTPKMSMCQNRIAEIIFIRSPDIFASANRYRMIRSCTAFCVHDIVILAFFIQMRTFRPYDIFHGAIPHIFVFTHQFHGFYIKFLDPYIPVTIIFTAFRIGMSTNIITFSILIKEQTWIDDVCSLNIIWLRPWSFRI